MTEVRQLVGYANFVRHNPKSDKFTIHRFSHLEFYCGDAQNTAARFCWGLGMKQVAKSDQTTGNSTYASYVLQSNELIFIFTAPYGESLDQTNTQPPHPGFRQDVAFDFCRKHGLAIRAVTVKVDDASEAYHIAVANGAAGVCEPATLVDKFTGKTMVLSEVKWYGDVVLRFTSGDYDGPALPNYETVEGPDFSYGLERLDHAVTNVANLFDAVDYMMAITGFHEFAEFVAADVGTVDSGLNSMVLANNSEMVLLPVNEPTYGTPRKSQIQTYLEQNEGPGIQHLALKTNDIFATIREMKQRKYLGGFDFMPRASDEYYRNLPEKIGDGLTQEQYRQIEELGLLADKDDQGILLQVFSKPVGDRLTLFLEIIQRVGCTVDEYGNEIVQKGGCGGFGKGNFSELFKSIENYEKEIEAALKK